MPDDLALALTNEEPQPLFTHLQLSYLPDGHCGELQLVPDATEVAAKRQKVKDSTNARAKKSREKKAALHQENAALAARVPVLLEENVSLKARVKELEEGKERETMTVFRTRGSALVAQGEALQYRHHPPTAKGRRVRHRRHPRCRPSWV